MRLRAEPLSRAAFEAFGDVIETSGLSGESINRGSTQKFADLARLELGNGGRAALHIFKSEAAPMPFRIESLERHMLGSQAFIPLHDRPFPVVVAAPGDEPDAGRIRAFITNGCQGVNLRPGTWHHYLLCLGQPSDFLVIDREGEQVDCETWELAEPLILDYGPTP